jgi:hypothetical protein
LAAEERDRVDEGVDVIEVDGPVTTLVPQKGARGTGTSAATLLRTGGAGSPKVDPAAGPASLPTARPSFSTRVC